MVASKTSYKSGSGVTYISKRSLTSTASSALLKEALLAKAATLKKKMQVLEIKAQLKAEMEKLEIETALAVSNGKIKVYQYCVEQQHYANQNMITKVTGVDVPKLEHDDNDDDDDECSESPFKLKHGKASACPEVVL